MKKSIIITIISIASLIIAVALIFSIAFGVLAIKTNNLKDDYSFIYNDETFSKAVAIDGIEPITQDISCGYAVIEMFSVYTGGNITEESLFKQYG